MGFALRGRRLLVIQVLDQQPDLFSQDLQLPVVPLGPLARAALLLFLGTEGTFTGLSDVAAGIVDSVEQVLEEGLLPLAHLFLPEFTVCATSKAGRQRTMKALPQPDC